ncbi:FtsX-like permease family protein [Catellatospora citrea]|uniref:FtsX-like permease family protein n=1 Tax=Catellatospora citrea TaxID=53366 RepID=UPI0033D23ECD
MRPSLALRLALAGTRTDRLRVALTAVTAALATALALAAATLLSLDNRTLRRYQVIVVDQPDLRELTVYALVIACLPVLALAAQATRIGAPARHRRLAALRLAGATPRQVTAVVAAETGAAAALGGLAGLAVFELARLLLHRRDAAGRWWLATDVRLGPVAHAVILIGLPALAALLAAVLTRSLHGSPLSTATRAARTRAPRLWPLLAVGAGVLTFVLLGTADVLFAPGFLLGLGSSAAMAGGLVLGMAWISERSGRLLHRFGRGPAALLAARRLRADPWTGSRTVGVLVVCALIAGALLALRDYHRTSALAYVLSNARPVPGGTELDYQGSAMRMLGTGVGFAAAVAAVGILLALLETVAARRRAFAALTAGGVTRGVLVRALLWQAMLPVMVAVPGAALLGAALARVLVGEVAVTAVYACYPADCSDAVVRAPVRTLPWFVDGVEFTAVSLGGLALVALLAVVAGATLRERTDLAALRAT